jgi:glycosyltransferase involved in cell wall biosynthesis
MKICQISTVHPLNDNRVFHKECKSLAQAGHEVTLIITHDRNETIDGVNIVGLKKRKNRFFRMLCGSSEALRYAFREKADVYHFHDPELIPMGMVLKLMGKKVIYDVHENTSQQMLNKEWMGSMLKRRIASALMIFFEWLSKISFDTIIVARPDIAKHWNSSKVHTVINAAVLATIDNAPDVDTKKTKPVVIYAGGLTRIRGTRQLIEAMELVGNRAELWLLGNWDVENFKRECENLTGWRYVRFLGYKSVQEVYSYMKKCDIGIVTFLPAPNHLTTLPNKPFEYMACRLPVIMSNFEYWQEIFGECALFVNPYDAEDIAEKILHLLDNSNEAKKLGDKGRELIEEEYNWEAEQGKLLDIYKKVLNK